MCKSCVQECVKPECVQELVPCNVIFPHYLTAITSNEMTGTLMLNRTKS